MNDFNKNIRTLIVCFVVAMFALIPLRFIEVGSQQSMVSQSQVLGETIVDEVVEVEEVEEMVIGLEAPYNELEVIELDEN